MKALLIITVLTGQGTSITSIPFKNLLYCEAAKTQYDNSLNLEHIVRTICVSRW